MSSISETSRVCHALIEKHAVEFLSAGESGGTLEAVGLSKADVKRLTTGMRRTDVVVNVESLKERARVSKRILDPGRNIYTDCSIKRETVLKYSRLLEYRLNSSECWDISSLRLVSRLLGFSGNAAKAFFYNCFATLNPSPDRVKQVLAYGRGEGAA